MIDAFNRVVSQLLTITPAKQREIGDSLPQDVEEKLASILRTDEEVLLISTATITIHSKSAHSSLVRDYPVTCVLTDVRLIWIGVALREDLPKDACWTTPLGHIRECYKDPILGATVLELRDHSSLWISCNERDGELLRQHIDRTMTAAPPATETRGDNLQRLCKKCYQPIAQDKYICSNCRAEYWSPKDLMWRTIWWPFNLINICVILLIVCLVAVILSVGISQKLIVVTLPIILFLPVFAVVKVLEVRRQRILATVTLVPRRRWDRSSKKTTEEDSPSEGAHDKSLPVDIKPTTTGAQRKGQTGTISFQCKSCGQQYTVARQGRGKRATCRSCGRMMRIPFVSSEKLLAGEDVSEAKGEEVGQRPAVNKFGKYTKSIEQSGVIGMLITAGILLFYGIRLLVIERPSWRGNPIDYWDPMPYAIVSISIGMLLLTCCWPSVWRPPGFWATTHKVFLVFWLLMAAGSVIYFSALGIFDG